MRVFFAILLFSVGLGAASALQVQDAQKIVRLHGRDEPQYLDPGLVSGIPDANIVFQLFEGLARYNPKTLEAEPGQAESWKISEDGKTYTFKLRSDLKWSDDTPLTARDFAYSWERVLRPATASVYAYQLYYIKNGEAYNQGKIKDPKLLGFQALDDATLRVTLNNPTPYFLKLAAFQTYMPVKREVVEKYGDKWSRAETMVSNGPFMLKSWIPQKEIVVIPNPYYWDPKSVKIAGAKYYPVSEYETALKMYDQGQLDTVWELPPIKVAELKGRPDFVAGPFLMSLYYWFNLKDPLFKDVRVRKAFAMAIDRRAITDRFLKRGDLPLGSFVPPGIAGYKPADVVQFDPVKAKALLKEVGYDVKNPFPSFDLIYNSSPEHKLVAEAIQAMWRQHLGVQVNLLVQEWKVYIATMHSKSFQMLRAAWVGDYVDPNTFLDMLYSKSPANHGSYNNPKYDELIAKAAAEREPALRSKFLRDAEEMMLKEVPLIPLYTQTKQMLVKPYLKGYYANILDVHLLRGVTLEGK